MKGYGQLQSADTPGLDFNVCASCLLSEKNGFHIVIPGTAPCEADNRFLFVVLVGAVATPTASHLSDTPFFYTKRGS